jgi:gamma-glutamyltranspeptidase / glutathione hydrolase
LARTINRQHAAHTVSHGTPPDWQTDVFKKHTTHFSVADAEGNWVACTATVNTSFGSKVVIPGTGVVMNNEMDDFSIQPGVSNYFGLIGDHANAVGPAKRPLSCMTPTLVLKDDKPMIALGAAGGPKIISQMVLEIVGLLDLGLTPQQAVAQPRIHHQWSPEELMIEKALPGKLQADLIKRGHKLKVLPSAGVSQMVVAGPDGQGFAGAADPRAGGKAAGW